jgi:mono/diheme cytochrome c family protein
VNGSGVPNIAPSLKGSARVSGDKSRLIVTILSGFNENMEIGGEYYANPMPSFRDLTDREIADVLTYIRYQFQDNADPVTPAEVKSVREQGN